MHHSKVWCQPGEWCFFVKTCLGFGKVGPAIRGTNVRESWRGYLAVHGWMRVPGGGAGHPLGLGFPLGGLLRGLPFSGGTTRSLADPVVDGGPRRQARGTHSVGLAQKEPN